MSTWGICPIYTVVKQTYRSSLVPVSHYGDVIMGEIAFQITILAIVYSTVYSDADQRKHQSSASLAFVRGIHRGLVNSPHKWPVSRKMFPFDDVIMHFAHIKRGFRSGVVTKESSHINVCIWTTRINLNLLWMVYDITYDWRNTMHKGNRLVTKLSACWTLIVTQYCKNPSSQLYYINARSYPLMTVLY